VGRFADLRVSVNDNEDTVNRNRRRPLFGTPADGQCVNTVSIPRETGVKKSLTKTILNLSMPLNNDKLYDSTGTGRTGRMPPLTPPRALIVRAHALEIFISAAAVTLGLFLWCSMKDSNSGVNLLAGAALVVAGVILFGSATRTILK
jgi:hypothetical protein